MLIALLTALTMIAFAANSVLCRIALGLDLSDPVSFTAIRLAAGAAALFILTRLTTAGSERQVKGSWTSAAALFIYAAAFSLAYLYLEAGTGALILFGSVQATMIGAGLRSGEQLHPLQWFGLTGALAGLFYLVLPGIAAPDPAGAVLMAISGIAWGVYSIRGKRAAQPVAATAGNFLRATPLAVLPAVVMIPFAHAQAHGIVLALVSGSVTSGLGYALWYRALRGLSTTKAAIVQLSVPVLAALGGVLFLSEALSMRLLISGTLVLGGVAAAILKPVSVPAQEASDSVSASLKPRGNR
jgi:drug/metabolite transporter (DMT)-like permease